MAVRYFFSNDQVLHIRGSTFEVFYQSLLEVIEENNIRLSRNLLRLVDDLETGSYGIGCNISDYIENKQDLLIFADLVKKAIRKFDSESPDLKQSVRKTFWDFHESLLKHAEELQE